MPRGGRPKTVSDEQFLSIVRESGGPAASTEDIAEHVDLTQRCVLSRLTDLAENEGSPLQTRTVGRGGRMWWLEED